MKIARVLYRTNGHYHFRSVPRAVKDLAQGCLDTKLCRTVMSGRIRRKMTKKERKKIKSMIDVCRRKLRRQRGLI